MHAHARTHMCRLTCVHTTHPFTLPWPCTTLTFLLASDLPSAVQRSPASPKLQLRQQHFPGLKKCLRETGARATLGPCGKPQFKSWSPAHLEVTEVPVGWCAGQHVMGFHFPWKGKGLVSVKRLGRRRRGRGGEPAWPASYRRLSGSATPGPSWSLAGLRPSENPSAQQRCSVQPGPSSQIHLILLAVTTTACCFC